MPQTITYDDTNDQWKESTHSLVEGRASLKRIDQAIQFRDEGEAERAIIAWIDEQN